MKPQARATISVLFVLGRFSNLLTNRPGNVCRFCSRICHSALHALNDRRCLPFKTNWRFRPNLTLNLGLRYEMSTVLTEKKGKLTNLPTLDAAQPNLGDPYFSNPTLRNFEPRIGFCVGSIQEWQDRCARGIRNV